MDEPEAAAKRDDRRGSSTIRPALRAVVVSLSCLALGCLVFLVFTGYELEQEGGELTPAVTLLVLIDVLVGLAASVAVGWVRTSRIGNLLIVAAAVISLWALPAWFVGTVRLGARRSPVLAVAVVVITAGGAASYTALRESAAGRVPADLPLIAVLTALGAAAALLWGQARGTRAALVVALREQVASAEASHRAALETREAQVARTLAEERTAIARDMHDGISHQLAIVAMHAGALAYRTDLSPEQQQSAARTVRDAASQASTMLRDSLTTLRAPDDVRPTDPLPDGASVQRIVDGARSGGQDVELSWWETDPGDLGQLQQRAVTVSRILEELLRNAQKYAPGASVAVLLSRHDNGYLLRVENAVGEPGQQPTRLGTGLGLIGVTERAELLGGSASFGPTADGHFVAEVRLP